MTKKKIMVGGKWVEGDGAITVINPYNGEIVSEVGAASAVQLTEALDSAVDAFNITRKMSSWERAEILHKAALGLEKRKEEIAHTISLEAGKPIRDARMEAGRSISTFTIAAEEAKRFGGEVMPLDTSPVTKGRWGFTRRFPVGPTLAISPFNFPLNLIAHKAAPAMAVGNPLIIKPSSSTPLTALILGEIILEAGWPEAAVSVVPCRGSAVEVLLQDERLKKLSFTGSQEVGWRLKSLCGKMKITLELGGNAAVIIDDEEKLDYAVSRCVIGAFSYAGQICISIQRIIVRDDLYNRFVTQFVEKAKVLKMGNPVEEDTELGPMIDAGSVEKAKSFIAQAVDSGANVLLGGESRGNMFPPHILENVPRSQPAYCEEIFAPAVMLSRFKDFEEALAEVNDSVYGLQAGVFTGDLRKAWMAFETIEAGGVMIGDIPTFRIDQMPYGGVKNSGFGREGIIYAMEEMSELKLMTINPGV